LFSDSGSSVTTVGECFTSCESDTNCHAVSLDWSSKECTKHTVVPHGSVCSGGSECEGETVAGTTCGTEVCFIREDKFSAQAEVITLGAGACAREAKYEDPDRNYATMMAVTAGTETLNQTYEEPYDTVVTSSTGQAQFEQACTQKCTDTADCRSVTMGLRQKDNGVSLQNIEFFCELENFTATQAVTTDFKLRAEGCKKFCVDLEDGVAMMMTCAECRTPTSDLKCKVKTARESAAIVRRGPGVCLDDNGDESTLMMSVEDHTPYLCQKECEASPQCTGASYIPGNASASVPSQCRLHQGIVQQASLRKMSEMACETCDATKRQENNMQPYECQCNAEWFTEVRTHSFVAEPPCTPPCQSAHCCQQCMECEGALAADAECFAKGRV
jgi:hypothetical protein